MKRTIMIMLAALAVMPPTAIAAQERSAAEIYAEAEACWEGNDSVYMNRERALELYRQAAEMGHAGAQFMMGDCYSSGNGVAKDLNIAIYWYGKAADQGDVSSMLNIGACYMELGDVEKKLFWYKKAAEKGDYLAQYNLGIV